MTTHLAAILPVKGQPLEVTSRPTPKPGPGELLIAVKSVALNPADAIMRDTGALIAAYPTVIGFDMAGLVLEVGDDVPTSTNGSGPSFCPGVTRVAAYAASFWRASQADYGAFQERCLVPWQHAVPLPDEGMSWNEAATLPVAAQVPLSAWDVMGIPRVSAGDGANTIGETETRKNNSVDGKEREALLIWGASSSVGTMGVQSARLLRDDSGERGGAFAAVYATAGSANGDYVRSLGADRVFDYKDPHVVDSIVAAAREDGLAIRHCFLATGELALCQAVLKAFVAQGNEEGNRSGRKAKIASAPIVPPGSEDVAGVEVMFVMPSGVEGERLEQFRYWMGTWLRENLEKKAIRPSPELRVVGTGLGAIDSGLDLLRNGVSCAKLVVEIAK